MKPDSSCLHMHVINSRYKCIITMDNMILQSEELWINISLKEQAMNVIINIDSIHT